MELPFQGIEAASPERLSPRPRWATFFAFEVPNLTHPAREHGATWGEGECPLKENGSEKGQTLERSRKETTTLTVYICIFSFVGKF